MLNHRPPCSVVLALALLGCGQRAGGERTTAASSASATVGAVGPRTAGSTAVDGGARPASSSPAASSAAVPLEPASPAPLPATFVGAKGEKACKAQMIELASYQQRGEVALGGHPEGVAAAWRVRLVGKPQEQVAFAAFDPEGRAICADSSRLQPLGDRPIRRVRSARRTRCREWC